MKETWPQAARILAAGGTAAEAARAAKVSERTVRRWRSDDSVFADEVDDYRAAMLEVATGVLASATAAAAQRLAEVATASEIPLQHQIRAGIAVLDFASRYRESHQLEARLRQLELHAGLRSKAPVP